jgi:hypothetical protein
MISMARAIKIALLNDQRQLQEAQFTMCHRVISTATYQTIFDRTAVPGHFLLKGGKLLTLPRKPDF